MLLIFVWALKRYLIYFCKEIKSNLIKNIYIQHFFWKAKCVQITDTCSLLNVGSCPVCVKIVLN